MIYLGYLDNKVIKCLSEKETENFRLVIINFIIQHSNIIQMNDKNNITVQTITIKEIKPKDKLKNRDLI
jgi:ABC-type lipoprotein export system ATPase subunit